MKECTSFECLQEPLSVIMLTFDMQGVYDNLSIYIFFKLNQLRLDAQYDFSYEFGKVSDNKVAYLKQQVFFC